MPVIDARNADRAGDGAAELILVKSQPLLVEVSPGVKLVIAQVLEQNAVDLVGPGSQRHVENAAGHFAVLCRVAGDLHLELLHRIDIWPELSRRAADVAIVKAIHAEI